MSRIAPLSGVLAVALLEAGLFTDPTPWVGAPSEEINQWSAHHSNAVWLSSATLIATSALVFAVFTAALCDRFATAGASRFTRSLLHTAGTMFATTVLVGAGLYAAPAVTEVFGGARPITADVYRGLFGIYNSVLDAFGPFAVLLLAVTAAVASFRVPVLPRWLAVVTIPLALLMVTSAVAPQIAAGLWVVITSATLAARPQSAPARTRAHEAVAVPI